MTAHTVISMSADMKLIDVNGNTRHLTGHQVKVMMTVGWIAFLGGWLMNILLYKLHPSAVDFSPKRFKQKLFIYICGKPHFFFNSNEGNK